MTDNERFELFLAISAQRRAKHESNLHQECSGCRVGLKWTEQEDIELINTLTACMFNNTLNLIQLSKCTDRPIWGLISRLKKLGLITNVRGYYAPSYKVWRPKVSSHNINETLKSLGWYYDLSYKNIRSPDWWANSRIKTGKK
ncbi:hypothetical protein NCTGTJJY_CDS0024 [Serratia phage 92A1]|nr:hypothetical protein NCTGTJJY_CDS0024 [Serratia phage 92A1]